jgi:hypothetical protein
VGVSLNGRYNDGRQIQPSPYLQLLALASSTGDSGRDGSRPDNIITAVGLVPTLHPVIGR